MNADTAMMDSSLISMGSTNGSLASTFGGRATAKSADELRKARETRATEALRMKDEQLKILAEQNSSLLDTLNKIEDEANSLQMEKIAIEQENRTVRDQNFELQSKTRAAETQAKRMSAEVSEKDKTIRILTDQNSELLRLLESEEALSSKLQGEISELRAVLDEIRQKYSSLLSTAKTHEDLATKAAREGQLRAEEIRLLRTETEHLKQQNVELKMKTQVEVENMQEQLRVRKEKQYQLLEKLQQQEEAKRQAEDQVTGMEEQLRGILTLPESNISDEEIHALSALLRNNTTITEINLRSNNISDDGARALGAVLASRTNIRLIDLRGNKISESAIRLLGEALQRSERIRHVYIHKNGKIDGLGAGRWAQPRTNESDVMVTVETICTIDVRDNHPELAVNPLDTIDLDNNTDPNKSNSNFQPLDLIDNNANTTNRTISPYKQQLPPSPLNLKNKTNNNKFNKFLPNMTFDNTTSSTADDKKKTKSKDEKLLEVRENLWQGRAGGLESNDSITDKEKLKRKKVNNKMNSTSIDFQLPPLIDIDNTANNDISKRGKTAPDRSTSPSNEFFSKKPDSATEAIVRDVLMKAKKTKGIRSTKTSETEKRLFNSPFAQSMVKSNEKSSP
eukprot:gene16832-22317_t